MQKPPNIKNFEILKCIGRGGMSTVWKARQVSLNRMVAIKVLDPGMAADSDDVERFYGEARAAGRLLHPGIVQVYDVGVSEGRYYFVMELVDGYTIGDWIRRSGRLCEKEILVVGECVATALDYAWREFKMVHCDVKPDNVMIDADGTVKVTDLGQARTIFNMQEDSGSNEVAGTPAYMSPEQVRGDVGLDFRSDIYGLGAMFYHLATGKMLFGGRGCSEIMDQQIKGRVCDALDLEPALTPAFCALVEKMLAKAPAHRHRNWSEVAADIKRVAHGHFPVHLLAPGLGTMKRSAARQLVMARLAGKGAARASEHRKPREKFPLAAVLTLAILFLAGFAVLRGMHGKQREIRAASDQRRDRLHVDESTRRREVDAARENAAGKAFSAARQWESEHPARRRAAASHYRRVAEMYPGSAVAVRALARAEMLDSPPVAEGGAQVETVKADLDKAAGDFLEAGKIEAAQAVYADYEGAFSDKIRGWRKMRVRAIWEKYQKEPLFAEPGSRENGGMADNAVNTGNEVD